MPCPSVSSDLKYTVVDRCLYIRQNDTEQNDLNHDTGQNVLFAVQPNVVFSIYGECRGVNCRNVERRSAACHCAECYGANGLCFIVKLLLN